MSGRSSEQVSFTIYRELPTPARRLVKSWVDRTGCDWTTALLNSGVMSGRHRTPEEEHRAALRREADEALDVWERLMAPPDDVTRRREASEHEAAHAVTAEALGGTTQVAFIGRDGSGLCRFDATGLSDLQRAAFWVAPELWITNFRAVEFPRGPVGLLRDRRDAAATGAELPQARRLAADILRANHDAVIRLADKIDADGHWLPPSAS
jgi:hypothetical protein